MTDFAQTYGWYPDVYTPYWFHKKRNARNISVPLKREESDTIPNSFNYGIMFNSSNFWRHLKRWRLFIK